MLLLPLLLACGEPTPTLAGRWEGGASCDQTWDYTATLTLSQVVEGEYRGGFDHTVSETSSNTGQEVTIDIVTRAAATVRVAQDDPTLDYELTAEELQCVLTVEGVVQPTTCAELGIGLTEDFQDMHLGTLTWDGADRIGLLDRDQGCAGELLRVVEETR